VSFQPAPVLLVRQTSKRALSDFCKNWFLKLIHLSRRTEPEAFLFDVYMNAQPITQEAKQAQKASNALVPARLAYAGGQMEFAADMGPEVSSGTLLLL
jgi:hypothetical protein